MEQNTIKSFNSELTEQNKFIARVYGWMSLALIITAVVSLGVAISAVNNPAFFKVLFSKAFYIVLIAEIALVWFLSARIQKMSVGGAIFGFLLYSVINGVTISSIFLIYQITSIVTLFFVTALTFGAMSLFGARTKKDVLSWGRYLSMALIGLIIASFVELLLVLIFKRPFSLFNLGLSVVGVIIFTLLTAYDTKKIMIVSEHSDGSDKFKKASILGALELYLDFINIFLNLLRIFGKRR